MEKEKMSMEDRYLTFLQDRLAALEDSDESDRLDDSESDFSDVSDLDYHEDNLDEAHHIVKPRRKLGRAMSSENISATQSSSIGRGAWLRVRQMIVKRRGRSLERKKKSCDTSKTLKRDRSLGTQHSLESKTRPRLTITMASGQELTLRSPPNNNSNNNNNNNNVFTFDEMRTSQCCDQSVKSLRQGTESHESNSTSSRKTLASNRNEESGSNSLPSSPVRSRGGNGSSCVDNSNNIFVYQDLETGVQHVQVRRVPDGIDQGGGATSPKLLTEENCAVKKSSGSSSTSTTESGNGLLQPHMYSMNSKGSESEPLYPASPPPRHQDNVNSRLRQADIKPEFRRKFAEWEVRKALAGHRSSKNFDELRQLMPDDFTKKLDQWEMLNANAAKEDDCEKKREDDEWMREEMARLRAERRELETKAKECRDREHKLRRMRKSCRRRRLTIRTERGQEFTLDNLSHTFAKRLYQWETENNIRPELSTLALINGAKTTNKRVTRSKSEGGGFELDDDNRRQLAASAAEKTGNTCQSDRKISDDGEGRSGELQEFDDEQDQFDEDVGVLRRLCKDLLQHTDTVDSVTLSEMTSTLRRLQRRRRSSEEAVSNVVLDSEQTSTTTRKTATNMPPIISTTKRKTQPPTSSSNASTPAESSLTRSSSLMSVEASTMHRLLVEDDDDEDLIAELAEEEPDLDQLCSLVQQLRDQDLARHKTKIAQDSRNKEKQ